MASPISLSLPGLPQPVSLAVAKAVQEDLEVTEQALSRFRPSAELVALNARLGQWTHVSPRLYAALAASDRAHRRTAGLFDPRVLARLEDYGYVGAPRAERVSPANGRLWLERRPRQRSVRIQLPVDLGGIGKGLGVRWAARIARRPNGNFLLNAGGDLFAAGPGPEGNGWQIGIEDPLQSGALIAALQLSSGGAVCTSSIARLRWQHQGESVHHLIDPRTGRPGGAGLLAVSVIAEDPAWAEVWSKTLFLHGAQDIACAAGDKAALWVTEKGAIGATPQAERLIFWRGPSAAQSP